MDKNRKSLLRLIALLGSRVTLLLLSIILDLGEMEMLWLQYALHVA